jgi:hypothetical protein
MQVFICSGLFFSYLASAPTRFHRLCKRRETSRCDSRGAVPFAGWPCPCDEHFPRDGDGEGRGVKYPFHPACLRGSQGPPGSTDLRLGVKCPRALAESGQGRLEATRQLIAVAMLGRAEQCPIVTGSCTRPWVAQDRRCILFICLFSALLLKRGLSEPDSRCGFGRNE